MDQGIVEYNRNESETNFYCTAWFSCTSVTLINGNNLFVMARSALYYSNATNFNNVYFYGRTGCHNSYVSNVDEVHCGGNYGCYLSI